MLATAARSRLFSTMQSKASALETAMRTKLETALRATYVDLKDVSGGCGAQFTLVIVAQAFEGVPLVKQQRLVNDALKEYLTHPGTVHSITMRTIAPSKAGELR